MALGDDRIERSQIVVGWLDQLFPQVEIPLRHEDPYTLLLAVLLSAQCTDERVNRITPLLFARAATPSAMIQLSVEEIEAIIRPCGLSKRKALAIHQLSELLISRHAGQLPSSFEALEALPGVGHKTASVVMVQAFGQPAFPVDTHIHRCAHRWGLADGKTVEATERALKGLYPADDWGKLHLQMILYARSYCPALRHELEQCPICCALATPERGF